MHKRLHQINSLTDDRSHQIEELQARFAHLEQDIKLRAHRQRSRAGTPQPDEVLSPLKHELHHRLQQGEELSATLSATQRELQASEEKLQVLLLHHITALINVRPTVNTSDPNQSVSVELLCFCADLVH